MTDTILNTLNQVAPINMAPSLDGEILTIANAVIGNADTSYTYVDLTKAGFNAFTLEYILTATTLTIEASNSLPSVADASAAWIDITSICTGGAATSFTAATSPGSVTIQSTLGWSRLRFKRVTTNATNAIRLILTRLRNR